jgi:hypothetical protein
MGLFGRKQEQAAGIIRVSFWPGGGLNGLGATLVEEQGEDSILVHAPALYLLRDKGSNARRFLDEVESSSRASAPTSRTEAVSQTRRRSWISHSWESR